MLMKLCLQVVAHDHTKEGGLRSDIENLQSRLAQYQSPAACPETKE